MIMRAFVQAFLIGTLLAAVSSRASLFAQGLLLTEFMADNATTLMDDEANPEDWLEIFNSGDTDVALEGYYLSDDAGRLTKWQFPAVTIGARRFLTVFCSGRDLIDPTLPIHTSFKLSKDEGESIYLVAPDGRTIISRYDTYPEQQPDISYGMATDSTFANPVVNGAEARVFVPTTGDLGLQWTQLEFDDSTWRQGTTAIGFGVRSPELELLGTDVGAEMLNVNTSIYIRIPFDVPDPALLDVMKFRVRYDDGFVAFVNGQVIASSSTAPPVLEWNSAAARSHVARTFEEFDVSSSVQHLKPGRNILAIQGLNTSISNNDLFILPQ
ncbi:MAG TPA: lamin tail domain-containing protein, partial [Planctomycetota bacterium]|nr:lamin tail domain-containing protein [Planctomycetota bacterium]